MTSYDTIRRVKKTIYHGSAVCVGQPIYGRGRVENDYGQGFYCTEDLELAREWACFEPRDGFANRYQIEMDGLRVLDLSEARFSILHWLVGYRADDSYFQFARSFLSNAISVSTLSRAMKLGGLGTQFVLKSQRAFDRVEVDGWVAAPGDVYFPKRKARDQKARRLYSELEAVEIAKPGVFLRDIISEKMEAGDARLQ